MGSIGDIIKIPNNESTNLAIIIDNNEGIIKYLKLIINTDQEIEDIYSRRYMMILSSNIDIPLDHDLFYIDFGVVGITIEDLEIIGHINNQNKLIDILNDFIIYQTHIQDNTSSIKKV